MDEKHDWESTSGHQGSPAVCAFLNKPHIPQGCYLFCLPQFTVKCSGVVTFRRLNLSDLWAELNMPTLCWSPGDSWTGSLLPSTWGCCFQLKSLACEDEGRWLMGAHRSPCWWGACQEESTEWASPYSISVCLDLLPPSFSLPGVRQWGSRGCSLSTPSPSIKLDFQQNSSLPKRYSGTNVNFIHSFNKHALNINYKPCSSLGAGDIRAGAKDKNLYPQELISYWV